MRAVLKIDANQLSKMDLDITLRMTVEEWRGLMRQMPNTWPSWRIGQMISTALGHVTRATEATFTEPKDEADEHN